MKTPFLVYNNKYIMHQMKLQPNPFFQVKSGQKTIEVRLNDEKRQQMKVGDKIEFSLATNHNKKITMKILELIYFSTFSELFGTYSLEDFGATTRDELFDVYKYYTKEDELKYGVVGIRLE
ncbi:MAG: ASCH domain-containing protein [Minisyncoccota bacterium]